MCYPDCTIPVFPSNLTPVGLMLSKIHTIEGVDSIDLQVEEHRLGRCCHREDEDWRLTVCSAIGGADPDWC